MKRTEDEQEYRRCSSCKMKLAPSMFNESSSSHIYKTCLSCRNKKRQKYYAGLKRKGVRRAKKIAHLPKPSGEHTPLLSISVISSHKAMQTKPKVELPSIRMSAAPVSKWIIVPSSPTTRVFLASVVRSHAPVAREQG